MTQKGKERGKEIHGIEEGGEWRKKDRLTRDRQENNQVFNIGRPKIKINFDLVPL
jgi:hypothetical protein